MKKDPSLSFTILNWVVWSLIGNVRPNLRGVSFDWEQGKIKVNSYFDGEIDDNDRELMGMAETEIYAQFAHDWRVDWKCIRLDALEKISLEEGHELVFHRFEEDPECPILSKHS